MANVRERYLLLKDAESNPRKQAAHIELCKRDIIYWFNTFCWTQNPKVAPYDFPFVLYHFQEKLVHIIVEAIENGDTLLIRKSREMGLSWIVLLVYHWYWLFVSGSQFMTVSYKEALVDVIGDMGGHFEKIRYNHKFLPKWMKPRMLRMHNGHMKFVNPKNGNVITGSAPIVDLGRGDRKKSVLLDELPRYPYGAASFSALRSTAGSIIIPYTPYGENNEAYRLTFLEHAKWLDIS